MTNHFLADKNWIKTTGKVSARLDNAWHFK